MHDTLSYAVCDSQPGATHIGSPAQAARAMRRAATAGNRPQPPTTSRRLPSSPLARWTHEAQCSLLTPASGGDARTHGEPGMAHKHAIKCSTRSQRAAARERRP